MAGAIFLAWATSLPELVVTISSVIRGSVEMGIGNILGSNIFNMAVLALAETASVSQYSVFEKNDGIMIFGVFQCVLLGILLILLMQEKLRRVGKVAIMPLFAMVLYCIGVTLL
jgi:cation:H+ antiporter